MWRWSEETMCNASRFSYKKKAKKTCNDRHLWKYVHGRNIYLYVICCFFSDCLACTCVRFIHAFLLSVCVSCPRRLLSFFFLYPPLFTTVVLRSACFLCVWDGWGVLLTCGQGRGQMFSRYCPYPVSMLLFFCLCASKINNPAGSLCQRRGRH